MGSDRTTTPKFLRIYTMSTFLVRTATRPGHMTRLTARLTKSVLALILMAFIPPTNGVECTNANFSFRYVTGTIEKCAFDSDLSAAELQESVSEKMFPKTEFSQDDAAKKLAQFQYNPRFCP